MISFIRVSGVSTVLTTTEPTAKMLPAMFSLVTSSSWSMVKSPGSDVHGDVNARENRRGDKE